MAVVIIIIIIIIPAGIYLLKVNNRNTKRRCQSVQRHQSNVTGVISIPVLLTLSRFHTLFLCFHCYLRTGKDLRGLQLFQRLFSLLHPIFSYENFIFRKIFMELLTENEEKVMDD